MAPGWGKNMCRDQDVEGAGLWEELLGLEYREPEEEHRMESTVRQVWGVMKMSWVSWAKIWSVFSKSLALWRTGGWGKVVREWLPYCLNFNTYFLGIRLFPSKFWWTLCWPQAHAQADLRWWTVPLGPPMQHCIEVARVDIFSWF